MTPSTFDAPSLEPVAKQIETFLHGRTFFEGAYVGTLTKPVLRALLPHFPRPGGLGVVQVCEWGVVPLEIYQEQDETVRGWIDLLGLIEQGIGPVELLVWEDPLTRSKLNHHIRKMRKYIRPEFRCNPIYKFPQVIILIGEAAGAAGHRLYKWTRFPGLAMGC